MHTVCDAFELDVAASLMPFWLLAPDTYKPVSVCCLFVVIFVFVFVLVVFVFVLLFVVFSFVVCFYV